MNNYIIKYILSDGKLFTTSRAKAENLSDKKLDDQVFLGFIWWQTEFDRADIYLQYTEKQVKVKSYDYREWLENKV